MHCLIVWAHPDPDSYSAALLDTVTRTLRPSNGSSMACTLARTRSSRPLNAACSRSCRPLDRLPLIAAKVAANQSGYRPSSVKYQQR